MRRILLAAVLCLVPIRAAEAAGACGPGNLPATGRHQGAVVDGNGDWYDASSDTTVGYTVRGTSPTSMAMVIYRWDGAADCRAIGGAFSNSIEADFSLQPGRWLINIYSNGATPGVYVTASNG